MKQRRFSWLTVYAFALLTFIFAPVVILILFSFNSSPSDSFPIQSFSLHWYSMFFDDHILVSSVKNSAIVAAAAAMICVILGTPAAIAIVRGSRRLGFAATGIIVLPLLVPGLLVGVSLLSFFAHFHIQLSLGTVIVGHVVIALPLVVLVVATRMSGIDPTIEEASAVLGANPLQTFRYVTWPLIVGAVISSALLVIAVSLGEFFVTFFTVGTSETLPLAIWSDLRLGVTPEINAVSTLMLAATGLLVVVSALVASSASGASRLPALRGLGLRRGQRAVPSGGEPETN